MINKITYLYMDISSLQESIESIKLVDYMVLIKEKRLYKKGN